MSNDKAIEQAPEKQKIVVNQEFIENRPLSYSSLKQFKKSPKHYVGYVTEQKVRTEQMILGSAIDVLVLTPEKFDKEFRIYTKPNLRTKDGKEEMQKLITEANNAKQTLITKETMNTVKLVRDSLYDHEHTRRFIENKKKVQIELRWRNRENDLPLRGFVDFESELWGEMFAVDLKTTNTADPDDFYKQVLKLCYHLQAATYADGYHKSQYKFPYFCFMAVETSEPFNVSVQFCDSKFMQKATEEYFGILKAFRKCMDEEQFHLGYEFRLMNTLDYFSLNIPNWYKPTFSGFDEV